MNQEVLDYLTSVAQSNKSAFNVALSYRMRYGDDDALSGLKYVMNKVKTNIDFMTQNNMSTDTVADILTLYILMCPTVSAKVALEYVRIHPEVVVNEIYANAFKKAFKYNREVTADEVLDWWYTNIVTQCYNTNIEAKYRAKYEAIKQTPEFDEGINLFGALTEDSMEKISAVLYDTFVAGNKTEADFNKAYGFFSECSADIITEFYDSFALNFGPFNNANAKRLYTIMVEMAWAVEQGYWDYT